MVNIFVGNLSYQTNQDELHAGRVEFGDLVVVYADMPIRAGSVFWALP